MEVDNGFTATHLRLQSVRKKMWNVRSIPSVFNRHGADITVLVHIKLGVLVQVPCLGHFCHSKFDVKRVGVLKILDGHGLKLRSKTTELAGLIKQKIGPITRDNFMPDDPDRLLAFLKARTRKERQILTSVANGIFNDLLLMTQEGRRLLSIIAVNSCPTGPAVDNDVHMNINLLATTYLKIA